jgi:hypothetical protein
MKSCQKFPATLAVVFLCLVFVTVPAYGYADPNTVGLISQILTPLLITAGACATFLRKSLLSAFSGVWHKLRRRSDA